MGENFWIHEKQSLQRNNVKLNTLSFETCILQPDIVPPWKTKLSLFIFTATYLFIKMYGNLLLKQYNAEIPVGMKNIHTLKYNPLIQLYCRHDFTLGKLNMRHIIAYAWMMLSFALQSKQSGNCAAEKLNYCPITVLSMKTNVMSVVHLFLMFLCNDCISVWCEFSFI